MKLELVEALEAVYQETGVGILEVTLPSGAWAKLMLELNWPGVGFILEMNLSYGPVRVSRERPTYVVS